MKHKTAPVRCSVVRWAPRSSIAACLAALCLAGTTRADERALPRATPNAPSRPGADAFAPADISIGEPMQLPFQRKADTAAPLPKQVAPKPQQPLAEQRQAPPFASPEPPRSFGGEVPALPQAAAAAPVAGVVAGSGWLGLSVDDSIVTGRLVIVEVAPQGPAAVAGVVPRDTLLAINGTPLHTADELAAALAAIIPGMEVKMAIGKGDRIDEVAMKAAARPREAANPAWQSAAEPATTAASPPAAAAPRSVIAPPAAVSATPPPAVAPQRFAPAPALPPRPVAEPLPAPAIARNVPVEPPAEAHQAAAKGRTALGVRTVPVDSAMQARFQLPEQTGAFVIGVVHDLPASKAGVPPGSVIVALDNQPVRGPADLTRLVTGGPVGAPVPIQFVLPGGEARRTEVMLQPLDVPLERALVGEGP